MELVYLKEGFMTKKGKKRKKEYCQLLTFDIPGKG